MFRDRYRLVGPDGAARLTPAEAPCIAEAVALAVGEGVAPPTVLVRHPVRALVLGRADLRLPALDRALAWARHRRLPVFGRPSGGRAVLVDAGCVTFAVARPCRDLTRIHANYLELAAGALAGLESLGLQAGFGSVPGSFCEGPFDLVTSGRKVAGVAQSVSRGAAVVTGLLLVSQDPASAVALLEAFYRQAGAQARFRPDAVTNLGRELGRPVSPTEAAGALVRGFGSRFRLEPGDFLPAELKRARALAAERRLA